MANAPQQSKAQPKVFVSKIIGGKLFSTVLDKGKAGKPLLESKGYSLISEGESLGRVKAKITIECPSCGCSKEAFERTGRFGCPDCYRTFGPFLPGLLAKMHKGTRHVGKIPARSLSPEVLGGRIDSLSGELDQAVRAENYEEAARLRDEIRDLEERRNALR
jgi:protein arginine kinase activator